MSLRYGQPSSLQAGQPPASAQARGVETPIPPASLCQVIAMSMCFRRLGFVALTIPIACAFSPMLITLLLGILNAATRGLGFICITVTALAVMAWRYILHRVAPSPEALKEALRSSRVRLPLTALFFSGAFLCILPEAWVAPMARWTPAGFPAFIGIRPAIGVALINGATLFRFVGPASFIRCSTVPLASNRPFLLPTAFPVLYRKCCRRYQFPTPECSLANFVVTCIAGYMVAAVVLLHDQDYDYMNSSVISTCLVTMVAHLLYSLMRHELNPQHGNNEDIFTTLISYQALRQITIRATLLSIVNVVVVVGLEYLFDSHIVEGLWVMAFRCFLISALLGFYTAAVEEAAKSSLFIGSKPQRFVQDVISDRDPNDIGRYSIISIHEEESFVVYTALHSLLYGDTALVKLVVEPAVSQSPNYLQLEASEVHRNAKAMAMMAELVLGMRDLKRRESSLEEDVLRISLLESLGGFVQPLATGRGKKGERTAELVVLEKTHPYSLSKRHGEAIEYWLSPPPPQGVLAMQGGKHWNNEPKAILLTRALSAFAGGLGHALTACTRSPPHLTTWLLRPGALAAAEYSVIALSRLFLVYFEYNKKKAIDYRRFQLSSLMPATLNSIFRLHLGILNFAHYREKLPGLASHLLNASGSARNTEIASTYHSHDHIMKKHPDLQVVLSAVENAAKTILQPVVNSHLFLPMKASLDTDCVEWIDKIAFSQPILKTGAMKLGSASVLQRLKYEEVEKNKNSTKGREVS